LVSPYCTFPSDFGLRSEGVKASMRLTMWVEAGSFRRAKALRYQMRHVKADLQKEGEKAPSLMAGMHCLLPLDKHPF
jgi:hypothetical protein